MKWAAPAHGWTPKSIRASGSLILYHRQDEEHVVSYRVQADYDRADILAFAAYLTLVPKLSSMTDYLSQAENSPVPQCVDPCLILWLSRPFLIKCAHMR